MREIWKIIGGFESYEVSNLGRIKSFKCNREKILKPCEDVHGYLHVSLHKDLKRKTKNIHKLVAIAFLGHNPCGHKLVVDHINNNKLDNNVENLQLITNRENAYKTQGKYSSKYKGVNFHKPNKKWRARIMINGKQTNIGLFNTEEEANEAYQNKLKTL